MCKDITEYLNKLRQELAGADVSTIQDALSDAEEHLTAAMHSVDADSPDAAAQLAGIIDEYGSPSEVASAYRIIERRSKPSITPPAEFYNRSASSRFVSVVYDPRAWGALLYSLTSIITGTLFFSWVIVGLALSVELMILIIGLPVAWLFFKSVHGIAHIEGRMIEGWLGVRMPCQPVFLHQNLKWLDQLKYLAKDKKTWRIIAYMILRLPLGVALFSVTIILIAFALELMAAPFLQYVLGLPVIILGDRFIYVSISWMPVLVSAGIAMFLVTMHAVRGMGRWQAKLAKSMLVG